MKRMIYYIFGICALFIQVLASTTLSKTKLLSDFERMRGDLPLDVMSDVISAQFRMAAASRLFDKPRLPFATKIAPW